MTRNSISPCKDCGDRAQGCHGKCERYNGWKAEQAERRALEAGERAKYGQFLAYVSDSARRCRKVKRERDNK